MNGWIYKGFIKDGLPYGPCLVTHSDTTFEGEVSEDSLFDGKVVFTYEDQIKKEFCEYKEGKLKSREIIISKLEILAA